LNNHTPSSCIRIPLGYNRFVLIDAADAVVAVQWRWQALEVQPGRFYASGQRTIDGKREEVYLHRLLMNPPDGMVVDHRNGDGLDCRRENMRVCTQQQNTHNRSKKRASKNPYLGVYKLKVGLQWHARIRHNKTSIYLGYFPTPEEAARAYDRKALELRGEYARLNFPDEVAS